MLLWMRLVVLGCGQDGPSPPQRRVVLVMFKAAAVPGRLGRVALRGLATAPARRALPKRRAGPLRASAHAHARAHACAGAALGLRLAAPALQALVVSCGPPLNTPPINSTVPKEEPSHPLGDSSQVLPSGLHVPTTTGIDSSLNVLSTSAYCEPLLSTATDQQTSQWLQKHRFSSHLRTFNSFCGADLLRLTRDDLIQICGLADGIRLFNALHAKSLAPALTIYLTHSTLAEDGKAGVFRALYLDALNCGELSMRLAHHIGSSPDQISDIYLEGPAGIRVLVTDDVVQHMKNDSLFIVEVCQDHSRDRFCLLMKPTTK